MVCLKLSISSTLYFRKMSNTSPLLQRHVTLVNNFKYMSNTLTARLYAICWTLWQNNFRGVAFFAQLKKWHLIGQGDVYFFTTVDVLQTCVIGSFRLDISISEISVIKGYQQLRWTRVVTTRILSDTIICGIWHFFLKSVMLLIILHNDSAGSWKQSQQQRWQWFVYLFACVCVCVCVCVFHWELY